MFPVLISAKQSFHLLRNHWLRKKGNDHSVAIFHFQIWQMAKCRTPYAHFYMEHTESVHITGYVLTWRTIVWKKKKRKKGRKDIKWGTGKNKVCLLCQCQCSGWWVRIMSGGVWQQGISHWCAVTTKHLNLLFCLHCFLSKRMSDYDCSTSC